MWKNYLKIAWRNLTKNKGFSTINILGLAMGLACSLVIFLWAQDERRVDGFHSKGDRLYQVYTRWWMDGKVEAGYPTQGLLAEELKKVIPEVELASGFEYAAPPGTKNNFQAGDKVSKMGGMFAAPDFLRMFDYPLLKGSAASVLDAPGSIAISQKMAVLFFGDVQSAIGKTIRFENKEDLSVAAVFQDVPLHSSLKFDFLRSWSDFKTQNPWVENWGNTSPATYVLLRQNVNLENVKSKIKEFVYRYQPKTEGTKVELDLQPFSEKYLYSTFRNGFISGGRIEYVSMFTIVAVFVLLIACINFMNLATARSIKRAKEVGLRKVVGALRSSLVGQFIGEAMLLTLFAMLLAVLLAMLFLPAFNELTGKHITLPFSNPYAWLYGTALLVVTGFIAGSYPALFLSSLNPVKVLKGSFRFGPKTTYLRKGLVVFQFTLTIILITGMIVTYHQLAYIHSRNLGYDRENLVYIPIEGELVKNYTYFKQQLAGQPGIESVSKMRNSPTVIEHHTGSIEWAGKDKNQDVSFADGVVGYDFVRTLKLQLKEGRDFSPAFGTDSTSYILNETAAARIGFKDPIGQTVIWGNRPGRIVGVLKDFHFASMHTAIDPLIIRLDEKWPWGTILVRSKPGETKQAIESLERVCKQVNPQIPFTYQFSDLEFDKLYRSEQVVSRLANYFALLAVFISCLGLFGLATYTAAQRTREIGIRKVLGASVTNVTALLSGDFIKLVLIAVLMGAPVAWTMMAAWLDNYAYRITLSWWTIALASGSAILIALVTVSYQSIRAALGNPVKALRSE